MPQSLPKFVFPVLIGLIVVFAGATVYFYRQFSVASKNPQQIAQAEARELSAEVGKLIVLPADESPTVATVSDPEALKDQAFFTGAKQGDKVLIYTNAKKAILYDPSIKKIINIAPINIGQGTPNTTPRAATPQDSSDN